VLDLPNDAPVEENPAQYDQVLRNVNAALAIDVEQLKKKN
jgi:hypothetical protein